MLPGLSLGGVGGNGPSTAANGPQDTQSTAFFGGASNGATRSLIPLVVVGALAVYVLRKQNK